KADEQGTKLIDPGKAAFGGKAMLVNRSVEQTFAPTFGGFAVALVLGDVGNDAVIETDLARIAGIEGTVGVEKRPRDIQAQTLQAFEGRLEVRLEVEGVVMIARHHARRSKNVPVGIHDGQN